MTGKERLETLLVRKKERERKGKELRTRVVHVRYHAALGECIVGVVKKKGEEKNQPQSSGKEREGKKNGGPSTKIIEKRDRETEKRGLWGGIANTSRLTVMYTSIGGLNKGGAMQRYPLDGPEKKKKPLSSNTYSYPRLNIKGKHRKGQYIKKTRKAFEQAEEWEERKGGAQTKLK